MLCAGIVISAVAMFLGIFTKLPQGGGGLVNNLMALSFFLPPPPLNSPPPPRGIIFDLETAIAENQLFYLRNPVVTRNGTQGPMPRPPRKLPTAPAENATFVFPTFSIPEFSFPPELTQFWQSIGTCVMVFMALCLPWLAIKKMSLLGKTEPALQAASKPSLTGLGELVAQIEPLNPLFEDLRIVISEHNKALAELESITKQAQETAKVAAEKGAKKEEELNEMRADRTNALTELEKETEKAAKLREEREREIDGHRKNSSSQMKAWMERGKKLEEDRAEHKKRHVEALNSLNMGRERETESWRRQVEELEKVKKEEKEDFGARQNSILERMKREREGWEKVKVIWKEEREQEAIEKKRMASEKKEVEEEGDKERKSWGEANDRAQRRIADLEEENRNLKDKAAERQIKSAEAEAAREKAEVKKEQRQKRSEAEAQIEGQKSIAMLEEEVLNGRKLIEDLQTDKRRDRQLLFELRAQLVRPTHAAPPSHINPLRFGGSTLPFMGPPATAGRSTFPYPGPPTFPITNSSSPAFALPAETPVTSSRPIVRLPFRPPLTPVPLPASTSPPPNAPKGPKRSQ